MVSGWPLSATAGGECLFAWYELWAGHAERDILDSSPQDFREPLQHGKRYRQVFSLDASQLPFADTALVGQRLLREF
jgi:hypothetical protein